MYLLLGKIEIYLHMQETFMLTSVIYKDLENNPPLDELCDCVTDDLVNGVLEELAYIAGVLREDADQRKERRGGGVVIPCVAGGYGHGGNKGGGAQVVNMEYLANSNKETEFNQF